MIMTSRNHYRPCSNLPRLLAGTLCSLLPAIGIGEFSIQKGELAFDFEPEVIQSNAREGKFLTVKLSTKPVSARDFLGMVEKRNLAGQDLLGIGVVVNSGSEDWPSDETTAHIRSVKMAVDQILRGNTDKGIIGFAEKYGARVNAIVPVIFEPGRKLYYRRKGKTVETPLPLNGILLAINDHKFAYREDGSLIGSTAELRAHMEESLGDGLHLVTAAEYLEQLNNRLAAIDADINRINAANATLNANSIEILLVSGFVDIMDGRAQSRTFLASTAEGRKNRKTIEEYFNKHGLQVDQGFDVFALHDTFLVHATGVYQLGCDLGDPKSCYHLAFNYAEGRGIEQDSERAARLYRQACDTGFALACKQVNR